MFIDPCPGDGTNFQGCLVSRVLTLHTAVSALLAEHTCKSSQTGQPQVSNLASCLGGREDSQTRNMIRQGPGR